ncbi:MAG: hypothetical protein IJ545_06985 [Alphaproteobacteria bacterium]|nr:hypothetical protein [Alphaproteobacteria bacterium]
MKKEFKPDYGTSYFDALKKYVALQKKFHALRGRYKFAVAFAIGALLADILILIYFL